MNSALFKLENKRLSWSPSVQRQHDQAALTDDLQLQHLVLRWLPEPRAHQRAAAWQSALARHRGEARALAHRRLHGEHFQQQHGPDHLQVH